MSLLAYYFCCVTVSLFPTLHSPRLFPYFVSVTVTQHSLSFYAFFLTFTALATHSISLLAPSSTR